MKTASTINVSNAVGFFLYFNENFSDNPKEHCLGKRFEKALSRLKTHVSWLQWQWLQIGCSRLLIWSHSDPRTSVVYAANGDIGIRIGSSPTICNCEKLQRKMASDSHYHPQWNGKFVFIRLNQQGTEWTVCNDWGGTIPVFRAEKQGLSVVSTSEPLTVAMMDFNEADISQRGLVELLHHGHFVASNTLYKQMWFLEPDSRTTWKSGRYVYSQTLDSVPISDERWGRDIDYLLEELKPLSEAGFKEALAVSDSWVIPLSGGLDSRIIAAYAQAFSKEIHTFTYNTSYRNLVCGQAVAKTLGINWQQVNVSDDYLNRFTPLWLDWFGTSMHAHGMYHGPLLEAVKKVGLPIAVGYLGGSLYGELASRKKPNNGKCLWIDYMRVCSKAMPLEDLEKILTFDPGPSIEAITEDLEARFNCLQGSDFQINMRFNQLTRQRHLITFQSTMYDWWQGVSTPYFNLDFGKFIYSLPEEAIQNRVLQKKLLIHLSPKLAKVLGTFTDDGSPLMPSLSYRLRHRLARSLPQKYKRGSLSVFQKNVTLDREKDALLRYGLSALYPLDKIDSRNIYSFFHKETISLWMKQAISGDRKGASRWLTRIQPLIYRSIAH